MEPIDDLSALRENRRKAVDALMSAPPIEVPKDPADLKRELDEAHDRFDDDRLSRGLT
jgi:hypothetical protein